MNEAGQRLDLVLADDISVLFKTGRRRYIRAVDHASFRIREGDIYGLLGPNGAGKSTAMYCMLGLIRPDQGEVSVFGQPIFPGAPLFEDIVYLPEEPHYHPYLTVEEALRYYGSLYRRSLPTGAMIDALARVGLENHRHLRIARCSKGMKQKVGLAACMLFEPRLMFLDEPTRGLDPIMVRTFRDYLLDLNRRGATIILNSHVLSEVELVCSRIAIMHRGRIVTDDDLANLVRIQGDAYTVTLSACDPAPEVLQEPETLNHQTTGSVREADLEALVRTCRERGIRLISCRAQTETLEDVFMRVVDDD